MKKYAWIIALLAALSLAIFGFGCDNGSTTPPPPPPVEDLEITDAADIGALLEAANWGGSLDHVIATGNVAHFNIPSGGSTDNNGFKLSFPAEAIGVDYLSVEVTFKVVEVTTLSSGKNAKIGFKSAHGSGDVTPYPDHELVFGTLETALGVELTQSFSLYQPNKLPNNAVWFSHNKYGDGAAAGSPDPVNYKLEITKIKFVGGAATPCCDDCTIATCADCSAGNCTDNCGEGGTCCLPPPPAGEAIWDLADWLDDKELGPISGNLPAPFVKAGDITATVTEGGLEITELGASWAGIDIKLSDIQGMNLATMMYKITVTGSLVGDIGTKIVMQTPGAPYTWLANQDVTTTARSFTLSYDIPADYSQESIRVQTSGGYVSASECPGFLLESIIISYEGDITIAPVDNFAITLTAPVKGAAAAAAINTHAQFTGAVTWSPAIGAGGTFAADTAYTASIVLTAKAGFTLDGLTADAAFTINGAAKASYDPDTKTVVSAAFPATDEDDGPQEPAVTELGDIVYGDAGDGGNHHFVLNEEILEAIGAGQHYLVLNTVGHNNNGGFGGLKIQFEMTFEGTANSWKEVGSPISGFLGDVSWYPINADAEHLWVINLNALPNFSALKDAGFLTTGTKLILSTNKAQIGEATGMLANEEALIAEEALPMPATNTKAFATAAYGYVMVTDEGGGSEEPGEEVEPPEEPPVEPPEEPPVEPPVVPDVTEGMTSIMRGADGAPWYVSNSGSPTLTYTAGGIEVTGVTSDYFGVVIQPQAGGGDPPGYVPPAVWTVGQKFVVRGKVDTLDAGKTSVDMVLQGTDGGYGVVATDAGKAAGDTFELVIEITAANVAAITADGNLNIRGSGNNLVGGTYTITGIWRLES